MFKKLALLAIAFGLIFGMSKICTAAEPTTVVCSNNMQFAELLAQKYAIVIEDTTPPMSAADKYAALSNALAEKGITFFLTAAATDQVTYDGVADVLLQITGAGAGADLSTCALKVETLVNGGLLTLPEGTTSANACGKPCPNVAEIFNNPLVVEKYTPPAGDEIPVGRPAGQPIIEQQASVI